MLIATAALIIDRLHQHHHGNTTMKSRFSNYPSIPVHFRYNNHSSSTAIATWIIIVISIGGALLICCAPCLILILVAHLCFGYSIHRRRNHQSASVSSSSNGRVLYVDQSAPQLSSMPSTIALYPKIINNEHEQYCSSSSSPNCNSAISIGAAACIPTCPPAES
jgi:hypothetical protein